MTNKKKKLTGAIAITTAATLLLGGTFAWQSISQTALNEKEAVINPGGRLHDDFDGTNKDIYVENFADNEIFARIRLDEYFEITMNKGVKGAEKTEVITTGATKGETATYVTHKFNDDDLTTKYWNWTTGGSTKYMPTFNKNKDSLVADVNGTMDYEDADGNKTPYGDYVDYSLEENASKEGIEIYDGDSNSTDEVGSDFDNLAAYEEARNIKTISEVPHTVKETLTSAGLISMSDWLTKYRENNNSIVGLDTYWVYDTDGWVYWSAPIAGGSATGLLLDEIALKEKMDDSYYYAINVTGQFITADDLGKTTNTGFYANNQAPSYNALTLLAAIGVDTSGEDYVSPFALTLTADKNYYLTGDAESSINFTLSATYDGEPIEADELINVKWSVTGSGGNTLSDSTKFTTTENASAILTVYSGEEGSIKVTVTATYKNDTVSVSEWITNGPPVQNRLAFHEDGTVMSVTDYYVNGKNRYELCFFSEYKVGIMSYRKEEAYAGDLQKYLAKDIYWVLVDSNRNETTVEGVTVTTDEDNPAWCTLTVPEDFDQKLMLGCKKGDTVFIAYNLMQKPTAVTLSANDDENGYSTSTCGDDSFNITAKSH